MHLRFALLSLVLLSLTTLRAGELDEWLQNQSQQAFTRMLMNISPAGTVKGVVVASPSQKDPDYYYHWTRDAAITMDVVCTRYMTAQSTEEKKKLEQMLFDFADFSIKNQMASTPSGGPGEPKFHVDGAPFLGPWGRPQDDGPALRASTLIHFAKILLLDGKEDVVIRRLYNGKNDSVIKHDLEYVSHHWNDTSFDLWEEVRGHQFFTAMVQRRALLEGAWLADRLGDPLAAGWYRVQARNLESLIQRHWDAGKGQINATVDRDGGINYKASNIDSAVVLGVLLGETEDGFFSTHDDRVEATVIKMERAFQALYPVNQTGQPGIAIGRYPEDRYDGYSTQGEGNPWVINTATLGEYYHRLARRYLKEGSIEVTPKNYHFLTSLGLTHLNVGEIFQESSGKEPFHKLVSLLVQKGDTFLYRVKFHADAGGALAEQINRHSGFMQGARDLTWSYGALLSAIEHRKPVAYLAKGARIR